MKFEDLYEGEEVNGTAKLYIDKNCTIPYTGNIEEYFSGKLSWECDIADGLQDGIERLYYDFTGELERINEVHNNMGCGLCIEYYKSGKISSMRLMLLG